MKIAIASGKGGTGKTTLSTNLAGYFAEKGEVILADLDVEEPNSGLFIKGESVYKEDKYKMIPEWEQEKCSLCGLCQDVCNFHAVIQLLDQILVFPELCHSCYACSELCPTGALPMIPKKMGELNHFQKDNLTFVESRLDIGQEQAVPLISQTNEYIDKHFHKDVLKLYDSPPGTSCPVIEAVKNANFVVLVTEPTVAGLHDLKRVYELVKKFNIEAGCIINKFDINLQVSGEIEDFLKEENIIHISSLPYDEAFTAAMTLGQTIVEYGESNLKKIVEESWEKVKMRKLTRNP